MVLQFTTRKRTQYCRSLAHHDEPAVGRQSIGHTRLLSVSRSGEEGNIHDIIPWRLQCLLRPGPPEGREVHGPRMVDTHYQSTASRRSPKKKSQNPCSLHALLKHFDSFPRPSLYQGLLLFRRGNEPYPIVQSQYYIHGDTFFFVGSVASPRGEAISSMQERRSWRKLAAGGQHGQQGSPCGQFLWFGDLVPRADLFLPEAKPPSSVSV